MSCKTSSVFAYGTIILQQYKDFHDDLFPDTKCGEAALDASQWFDGQNAKVSYMGESFEDYS